MADGSEAGGTSLDGGFGVAVRRREVGQWGHSAKEVCDTFPEVFEQMPPVRNLFGLGGSLARRMGITDSPVPAHDLDGRVVPEPGRHRLGGTIR